MDTPAIIETVDLKKKDTVTEAANLILAEEITAGSQVAVIDDPTYSQAGQRGRVRGSTADRKGYVDVEFANGMVVPLQSSLLITL
jgi:hypothetical protein